MPSEWPSFTMKTRAKCLFSSMPTSSGFIPMVIKVPRCCCQFLLTPTCFLARATVSSSLKTRRNPSSSTNSVATITSMARKGRNPSRSTVTSLEKSLPWRLRRARSPVCSDLSTQTSSRIRASSLLTILRKSICWSQRKTRGFTLQRYWTWVTSHSRTHSPN